MRSFGYTLEECGIKWGVTRERARQIEVKAKRILMHPTNKKMIFGQ